jgi:hypothetical protein
MDLLHCKPWICRILNSALHTLNLSRTCGVSIFIDYCTVQLPATQRKMKGEERDTQLINVNEANSCLARGYCMHYKPAQGEWCLSNPPPPPTHSPCRILAIFSDLGQKRGWPRFRGSKVLQLNLDSFCDHVRIFGAVIHCKAAEGYYSLIVPCMEMGPRTTIIQRQRNRICVLCSRELLTVR